MAVIPGGSSVRMVPAAQIIDTPMDFDSLGKLQVGPRHCGGDRDGQVHRHHSRHRPHFVFLQARELWPVHAVPRGHGLDVAGDDAHGGGPRAEKEIDMLLDVTKQIEGHTSARSAMRRRGRSGPDQPLPRRDGAAHRPICRQSAQRARARGGGVTSDGEGAGQSHSQPAQELRAEGARRAKTFAIFAIR